MFLKKTGIRKIAAALSGVLLTAALALPAAAAEVTLDCTYIPITSEQFVADTFCGVPAYYNLNGPTYYCSELIPRFYKEVYGLDIVAISSGITVQNGNGYHFVVTDNPQPGDILYGSAESREKGYSHWAIVKANNGDSLTLFEQNWRWNGQAGIDRELEFPTTAYVAYTLVDGNGQRVAPPAGTEVEETLSAWAEEYVAKAAQCGVANLSSGYQKAVTREDFCQMAVNILSQAGITGQGTTACEKLASLGLLSDTNGVSVLNRQEAAVIVSRVLDTLGADIQTNPQVLSLYADQNLMASWATGAIAELTVCGFMSGSNGSFDPLGVLTNEQAVALMMRVYENPAPVVTPTYGARMIGDAAESVLSMAAGNLLLAFPEEF